MSSLNFKVGQAVWAKMKGYPLWPGKIMNVQHNSKQKNQEKYQVFFFGTYDHAWINLSNLTPHSEDVISTLSKRRTALHQVAIDELIKYYIEQEEESSENSEHQNTYTVDSDSEHQNTFTVDSDKNEVSSESSISLEIDSESENVAECEPSPSFEYHSENEDETEMNTSSSEEENQPSTSRYRESVTNKRSPNTSPISHDVPVKHRRLIPLPIRSISEIRLKKEPENNLDKSNANHLKLGFIGLGNLGRCFVRKLLSRGNRVSIWHDELSHLACEDFQKIGATIAKHPEDLILNCDITFCNVKDSNAVKDVLFSNHGVIRGLEKLREKSCDSGETFYRGYVEMSPIDWETSTTNSEAVILKGGHYLEACTISEESEKENFVFLIAGEYSLYETIKHFLNELALQVFFISIGSGNACRMRTLFNALTGTICAAFAESIVLTDRLKLPKDEFVNVVKNGPVGCMPIVKFAQKMAEENFKKDMSVNSIERELFGAVAMGHKFFQDIPVISAASDLYRRVRRLQNSADMSAVYKTLKYS